MGITFIDSRDDLTKLKNNWTDVHLADPHASIFMSWEWLKGWIDGENRAWRIIALRPVGHSGYIAFMAVALSSVKRLKILRRDALHMGGNPLSDHTGFLCVPEYGEEAIINLACAIQNQLRWNTFYLQDVFDPRLEIFLRQFSPNQFTVQHTERTASPYINLPKSWEEYLQKTISSGCRYETLRSIRRVESLNQFQISHVREDNLESQIDTFIMLHQARFGTQDRDLLRRYKIIFRSCFERDCLWLAVMWAGDKPIVAMAAFIDLKKKSFCYYLPGFNSEFERLAPGRAMNAYSIRWAIDHGFHEYDFLRGNEAYKYEFGAVNRYNDNVVIKRRPSIKQLIRWK